MISPGSTCTSWPWHGSRPHCPSWEMSLGSAWLKSRYVAYKSVNYWDKINLNFSLSRGGRRPSGMPSSVGMAVIKSAKLTMRYAWNEDSGLTSEDNEPNFNQLKEGTIGSPLIDCNFSGLDGWSVLGGNSPQSRDRDGYAVHPPSLRGRRNIYR